MSSNPSQKPNKKGKGESIRKFTIFLGLGLGFSGELIGSAWLGYQTGVWWVKNQEGSNTAPGLFSVGFVMVALCHIVWILLKMNQKERP